ncbi:MAG: DNA polymerase III subunit delta [Limimaricola sp.]|uniref:DNA polymerase III subunit delta n=1 Tax=Limimaricola sp. TaxID=2211665 RepID=UPI001E09102F|nr:DNA polymerase III subunit delta [Limimaricola sp.]MBI1417012.1 DNA polymerase III subunit delta [Limimaricola sp.]
MKLNAREAAGYFRKPDPRRAGLLIHGADPAAVDERRREVALALAGPDAEADMRVTRIAAADLRKDPALLDDAMRAQGFFAGMRLAIVEGASDGLAPVIAAALDDWREGDAVMIVTANALPARSALRKAFEGHRNAVAVGLYADPPGRDEVAAVLAAAGVTQVGPDAMDALMDVSRNLDPGDLRQLAEKLSLYAYDSDAPVSAADVAACAPLSMEAELDTLVGIVAEGRAQQIGPVLRQLFAQGTMPVGLCIAAGRYFRTLHSVATAPGGASSGIDRLRPPVYGPRRDALQRQAAAWRVADIEAALSEITATDLQLRSTSRAPEHALVERALIRIAMRRAARG